MRRLARSERGTAIITAIALMTVMSGVALATYSFVDTQQLQSTRERHRESTFNLTEAVLNNQTFILSRRWAGTATSYPASGTSPTCSSASAPAGICPQPAQINAAYDTADYKAGNTSWQTTVWDDAAGPFYDSAHVETAANAHWDANKNDRVWISASSTVDHPGAGDARTRKIVALVRVTKHLEELPRRVIVAGKFKLTPNGNHAYVETKPDQTSPHNVTLRCNPPSKPSQSDPCMAYEPGKNQKPQIDPPTAYEGPSYVNKDALDDEVKERLKERAMADGTYYTGCPSDAQLAGEVVWVSGCLSNPDYKINGNWNSPTDPGILIWEDGVLTLNGNSSYYGVVYHLNLSDSTDYVVQLRGGLTIFGGVFVDGPGGIDVGSNKVNITYHENAFGTVSSYGSAGIVQNSWREIGAD